MPRRLFVVAAAASVLALSLTSAASPAPPPSLAIVCTLPPGAATLPADATHGLADHLRQYPAVALATPAQRASAARVLRLARESARRFRDVRAARRAGFATRRARHAPRVVGILHAESRRYSHDARFFDPRRPEALIYANQPGRRLVLIGVMFSMPRGKPGRGSLGPLGRWHSHVVCVRRGARGRAPLNGSCPRGARLAQGSEMLHLWFTRDLRSAYAVHAPLRELCRDGLLARSTCRSSGRIAGM